MHLPDRRQRARVATPISSSSLGIVADEPCLFNVSHGGACLWLQDPPAAERDLVLQFRYGGHDLDLPSRVVWSRPCTGISDREHPPLADGWLVGFAFSQGEGDAVAAEISHGILASGHIKVKLVAVNDAAGNLQKEGAREPAGVITFSEQSIVGVKAAAKELLPVLAEHFTDVHMVFTRDRLEISAPFRTPANLSPSKGQRRDYRAIQANHEAHPPLPARIEPPAALVQPEIARAKHGRWRVPIAVSILAVVILGWILLGLSHKSGSTQAALNVPVEGQRIPPWAAGIDQTALRGWIEIQKKFDLPDATVRSAIQILQANDRFSPGHTLRDLASYPAEVKRAFSFLAGAQKGTSFDFGPLTDDLKGRMTAGARFPDEEPGGHYSWLQRESLNNVVVLETIELFRRRQDDPTIKEILAALRPRHA